MINRRGFIKRLGCLPFVGGLFAVKAATATKLPDYVEWNPPPNREKGYDELWEETAMGPTELQGQDHLKNGIDSLWCKICPQHTGEACDKCVKLAREYPKYHRFRPEPAKS